MVLTGIDLVVLAEPKKLNPESYIKIQKMLNGS